MLDFIGSFLLDLFGLAWYTKRKKERFKQMKKWIFLFLTLFFGFIFSLKLQNDSVPNIFIIEIIVLATAYILQAIFRIAHVFIIKKKAKKIYECNLLNNNVFKLLFSVLPKHISLHSDDNKLNLILIFVRRKHAKYHFDSKKRIEIYVGNRETYRTGKVRYSIGNDVTWKLTNKINVSLNENAKTVFVLTKKPMDVTCSDKAANEYLTNSDVFFEDCTVYSEKYFMDKI